MARDEPIWRSIRSAPRDGTRILAWSSRSRTYHVLEFDRASPPGWISESGDYVVFDNGDLTHWTTLPLPPPAAPPRKRALSGRSAAITVLLNGASAACIEAWD